MSHSQPDKDASIRTARNAGIQFSVPNNYRVGDLTRGQTNEQNSDGRHLSNPTVSKRKGSFRELKDKNKDLALQLGFAKENNNELMDQVEKMQTDIDDLTSQLYNERKSAGTRESAYERTKQELHELSIANNDRHRRIMELNTQLTQLRKETRGPSNVSHGQQGPRMDDFVPVKELRNSQARNNSLVEENKELQQRLKEQEIRIAKVQEDAFRANDHGGWTIDPDPTIGADLVSLERAVKAFSKKYAVSNYQDVRMSEIFFGIHDWQEILAPGCFLELSNPRNSKYAPHLLLSAVIARQICNLIFAQPFYFVPELMRHEQPAKFSGSIDIIQDFMALLERYHGGNSKKVNTFRSDALRLLQPAAIPAHHDDAGSYNSNERLAKRVAHITITETVLSNLGPFTQYPRTQDCAEDMLNIVEKASEIAWKLNTQRSRLIFEGIEELPREFHHASKIIEAHNIHYRELDDSENALDGRKVLLVTQPAIVAIGKSDGSDYSVRRVLKKAVVWMGKSLEQEVAEKRAEDAMMEISEPHVYIKPDPEGMNHISV